MYEAFFGLRSRPFSPLPRVETFIPLAPVREPFESLVRCIAQEQGIGVLTAPSGAGKSLVCRLLQQRFSDVRRTVLLTTARFPTRRALLQAILFELKHPFVGLSEQESRLRVLDLLQASPAPQNRMLLIVDEAHLLSPRGLEELRTLTDYEIAGTPCVSLILSGQLELEELLIEPEMNAINQRVGCHVCIEPLTFEESAQYVRERLRFSGNDGLSIFTPEAIQLIGSASEGNPRRLNQLSDHSLLLAYAEEQRPVDESIVRAALLDLRELPLHWNAPLDLTRDSDRNPLEAFAESHEAEEAVLDDEPLNDGDTDLDLEDDSSFEASDFPHDTTHTRSSESSVFEVGSPFDASPFDQLFQVTQLIVPGASPESVATPYWTTATEPRTPATSPVFETAPPEDENENETMSLENLSSSGCESAVESACRAALASPPETNTSVRPAQFEELVVDDSYAQIDRQLESSVRVQAPLPQSSPCLVSPASEAALPPAMTTTPPVMADVNEGTEDLDDTLFEATSAPAPIETAADFTRTPPETEPVLLESQLLDFINEFSVEVHQVRRDAEAVRAAAGPSHPQSGDIEVVPSTRPQSLRESFHWQFDVVEPESVESSLERSRAQATPASPTESLSRPQFGAAVHSSTAPPPPNRGAADPSAPTPVEERRYAQLFTRLQRQRRRIETVMTRERRAGVEVR